MSILVLFLALLGGVHWGGGAHASPQERPILVRVQNQMYRDAVSKVLYEDETAIWHSYVNKTEENHLTFSIPSFHLETQSVRIVTQTFSDEPLHVTIRHKSGQLTWEHRNGTRTIGKTVCLEDISETYENLTIIFSTYSLAQVELNARITLIQNYIFNQSSKMASVTPTKPYVWTFRPDPERRGEQVRVFVESEQKDVCGFISISPLGCPFHDVESEAQYNARWQTMLGQSTIGVKLEGRFEAGFNIIALTKGHDRACLGDDAPLAQNRTKILRVQVLQEPDSIAVIVLSLLAAIFALVIAIGAITYHFNLPIEGQIIVRLKQLRKLKGVPTPRVHPDTYRIESLPRQGELDEVDGAVPSHTNSIDSTVSRRSTRTVIEFERDLEVDEVDCRTLPYKFDCTAVVMTREVRVVGTQTKDELIVESFKTLKRKKEALVRLSKHDQNLMLDNLAMKYDKEIYPSSIKLKSSLYTWIIFLMGTFYTIPVVQLLLHHQNSSLFNGNLDICYYNYQCKYAFMKIEDFGHIFSNIAYIALGGLYMAMTKIRQTRYTELCVLREEFESKPGAKRGIPEQYGIFYALGGAMIMEGILSACYHICPTKINFQFDTTFMYILAILCFLKIYQFRHPDITSNAYTVFSFIGVALLLEVFGYYWDNLLFWAAFILYYFVIILTFIVHTYYYGRVALLQDSWKAIFKNREVGGLKPARKIKFGLCVVVTVINSVLAVMFLYRRDPGISKYLLIILIGNMVIYVFYYCGMKLHYWLVLKHPNEKISLACVIYLLLSVTCVACGMTLFTWSLRNSALSPALSRDMNKACAVSIFDYHDLWHFFSAAGLYTMFMMVMTLEDENLDMEWKHIHVF